MKYIHDEQQFLDQIMTLISKQCGNKCEIVLHDLTKDYNHTIVDIRNGHITNRTIGGCGSNLGLEVLSGNVVDGDRFNYIIHTPTGRILRSSTIYMKDQSGKPLASLCVNLDITETVQLEAVIKSYNNYDISQEQTEIFAQDVSGLLDQLIIDAQKITNKPFENMNREEKIEFINYLDKKGAFMITHSSEKMCELLSISRFTFYNYLETARSNNASKEDA